jgi:hypothetical protein
MSLRLVICDPAFIPDGLLQKNETEHEITEVSASKNEFLKAFQKMAASGDARIHLINGRFQDLVSALPDLVGETDRERHMQRIQLLRAELDYPK